MSAKKKFKVRSQVWLYPGDAAWYFANVDKKQSADLKEKYAAKKRGFGSIPVKVTLGTSVWKTSVFPDKRSGTYLLPLKAQIRRTEGIDAGEYVDFTLEPLV